MLIKETCVQQKRPDVVKVSWSGGKDSSCALKMHLDLGHIVKAVCYVPMLTNDVPLLTKEHYDFLIRTAELFRSQGAEVHIVSGLTYCDYVIKRSTRGKHKGRVFGFPAFQKGWCGFKRDSKLKAISGCDVGIYDYEDIGIAYDERDRQKQLTGNKRSILCETKMTEEDAYRYAELNGILSPHYKTQTRDGCILCPNANKTERERWYKDYPEAKQIVIELQEFVKRERPEQYPLRGHKWFIEECGKIN